MDDSGLRELSCAAKIARVVLENCGPLAPSEVAGEAHISSARALEGLAELAEEGYAEPVCGVCSEREEVYALTERGTSMEPSP